MQSTQHMPGPEQAICYCFASRNHFEKLLLSPDLCSIGWAPSHKAKGHGFGSRSGYVGEALD